MIREKKKEGGDLLKTSNPSVVEKNKSLSVEKDGKEKGVDDSPGNGVQYVVTYVGTAQQVESSSQTRSDNLSPGGDCSTACEENKGRRFLRNLNFWADSNNNHVIKADFKIFRC